MSQTLDILQTTENAFISLLQPVVGSMANVYPGVNNIEDMAAPAVICWAEDAWEDIPFSGMYHVNLHIYCKEMAADSNITSSLSTTVFSASMNNETKGTLNTYPGYYVYEYFVQPGGPKNYVSGDAWVKERTFDVISALIGVNT